MLNGHFLVRYANAMSAEMEDTMKIPMPLVVYFARWLEANADALKQLGWTPR